MVSQPEITWHGNTQVIPRFPVKKPTMDIAGGDGVIHTTQSGRSDRWETGNYTKKGVVGFDRILPSSYKSMKSMLSWIKQGRLFSYLSDSSLIKINTTVYSQISSTVLEVTDATNIAAAQELYLRTSGWLEEVGTVSSTTGTVLAWTTRTSETVQDLNAIAYGAGVFCAVGVSGTILTSPDGSTWTLRTGSLPGENLYSITYGNGLFVVGSYSTGYIMTSPDGITWTTRFSTPSGWNSVLDIVWSGTKFVAGAGNGYVLTSSDGITWAQSSSVVTVNSVYGIAYSSTLNLFVACTALGGTGGKILTSPDGITWTLRTIGSVNDLRDVIWSGTQFIAVGDTGTIITSTDGITWTSRTPPSANSLTGITWTGRQFIAVSSAGTYATSTDGITWSQTALAGTHNAILSAPNLYLICGGAGEIYTSVVPNRVTFTAPLLHTYASGDILRMDGYYPSVTMIPNSFREGQTPGIGYYNFEFGIQEMV